jgi:hypothetical protein
MNNIKNVLAALGFLASTLAAAQQAPGQAQQADTRIDGAQRSALIDGVIRGLNQGYVFPAMAKKVEADSGVR